MSWFRSKPNEQDNTESPANGSRVRLENNNGPFTPQHGRLATTDMHTVVGGRLYPFADGVGFNRDGYCRADAKDGGNHSVAATVTQAFLDYTQSKGNNLTQNGVKDGMKWCLCASRWKEAYEAFEAGQLSEDAVPKVHLHASDAKALDVVSLGDLSKFKEGDGVSSHRSRNQGHIDPKTSSKTPVRETGELSGAMPGSNHQGTAAFKKTELGGGTGTG